MKADYQECFTCGLFATVPAAELLDFICPECGDALDPASRQPRPDEDPYERPLTVADVEKVSLDLRRKNLKKHIANNFGGSSQ